MSDIKFDGENVIVEGHWLKSRTWDIMLDASDRRLSQGGFRRALVHDPHDRLTINYNHDYPNGVQIEGQLVVDGLFVRGKAGFAGGIDTPDITVGHPSEPPLVTVGGPPPGGGSSGLDLVGAVRALEQEIAQLKARVAALEAAHP